MEYRERRLTSIGECPKIDLHKKQCKTSKPSPSEEFKIDFGGVNIRGHSGEARGEFSSEGIFREEISDPMTGPNSSAKG